MLDEDDLITILGHDAPLCIAASITNETSLLAHDGPEENMHLNEGVDCELVSPCLHIYVHAKALYAFTTSAMA